MSTSEQFFECDTSGKLSRAICIPGGTKGMRGASGTVYVEKGINKAIKIFHKDQRIKFEAKVRCMRKVAYSRPDAQYFDLAWPEVFIADSSGRFVGYRMPLFGEGWVDLESLIQASEAERKFHVGEKERLIIGANLAMAIAELHALGIRCVDLKPQNVRVRTGALSVGIIDCDGMSVPDLTSRAGKRFHADKCTPDFWAPENIGRKAHDFVDENAHDCFALAVILFMLLNRGIHPFQGTLLVPIPGAEDPLGKIKNDLYPYGLGRGKISPHRMSLYPYWPSETRLFFDRAFSRTGTRPRAGDWYSHLEYLIGDLKPCSNYPTVHVQYSGVGCPICSRDQETQLRKSPQPAAKAVAIISPITSSQLSSVKTPASFPGAGPGPVTSSSQTPQQIATIPAADPYWAFVRRAKDLGPPWSPLPRHS